MTDSAEEVRAARRARHAAIRAEVADEETEAAEAEAADAATLDVSLHLRISHALPAALRGKSCGAGSSKLSCRAWKIPIVTFF
ncbi:hypothetical protein [Amycolatopsis pithecellobii]|uniref:Uncharacterized protein n=1 Tax=Amycolatopsis pithecellobii TaxID=664692 RepID=A0A6N7Z8A8_9PSEU|nr:hypothetical protein [Amycolatopsis pithecellobii]MTD56626.1 hypothetical protein [Amycolatopsis pithecellobii]